MGKNTDICRQYGASGNSIKLDEVVSRVRSNVLEWIRANAKNGAHNLKFFMEIDQDDADYVSETSHQAKTPEDFVKSFDDAGIVMLGILMCKDSIPEGHEAEYDLELFIDDIQEIDDTCSLYDALYDILPHSYTGNYSWSETKIQFVDDGFDSHDLAEPGIKDIFGDVNPFDIDFPEQN